LTRPVVSSMTILPQSASCWPYVSGITTPA
jgi:hypothetical protein